MTTRLLLNDVDIRVMLARIDEVASEVSLCYEDLAPAAKARALELSHGLADLRKQLSGESE